jgi:hypothetical protein
MFNDHHTFKCYDGAPNTALRNYLKRQEDIRNQLKSMGYRATYFPVEEQYMLFDSNCKIMSDFIWTLEGCLHHALQIHNAPSPSTTT